MININRVVPVQATDLITLYSRIFAIAGTTITAINANGADGDFTVSSAPNALLCAEPVASLDFAAAVTSATVYFAPAYNYSGFSVAGAAVETAGATVENDPGAFYSATLSGGTVTIAKIGA